MVVTTKTCSKCGDEKPLTEYYKHVRLKHGVRSECKVCTKNVRLSNIEYIRAYDRERGSRQSYQYTKEYREQYPNKYKAHSIVNRSLRSGKLVKPDTCTCCGSKVGYVVAHHDDYLKPLDIRWLCEVCHKQWHSLNGEGKNGRLL